MNISSNKRISRFVTALSLVTWAFVLDPSIAAEKEDTGWVPIAPGVELRKLQHHIPDIDRVISLNVVRVDPRQARIEVLDTYSTLKGKGRKYASYSLRELQEITNAVALINGGFTQSYTFPIPAGLVVQNKVTVSTLNRTSRLQSGVFCVNDDEVIIVNKSDYLEGACLHALQSGPKVVEYPGENGISRRKKEFERSIAGVDKEGRVLLVRASKASLYDLAELLRAEASKGGFDCQAALNLSGDVQSGLLVVGKDNAITVGEIDTLVASAIAIIPELP